MTEEINTKYETVIGLEIHMQLKTKSKMFSPVSNDVWQAKPNSHVGPVELGLPGALPVPNEVAIKWTQRLGKLLNCEISQSSKFDRKNYFYPDLPKGYQISQYDEPFCTNGYLDIPDLENADQTKRIRIRRIHLEEDTGKSMHKDGSTYLDFNKAGVPLVELVTEPDFSSPEECSEFAKMIQEAARTLGISNADMEKGNLRLEANISVRPIGQKELPDYRVEIKNINSFKFMRDATNYEIERQIKAIENGETLAQETRGWNENKGETFVQRSKEEAHDYRYFPEPDIPPLQFNQDYFDKLLTDLPKMPWDREQELIEAGVRPDFAKTIIYSSEKSNKLAELDQKKDLELDQLAKIIVNTADMNEVDQKVEKLLAKSKDSKMDDVKLTQIVDQTIEQNPQAISDYKKGKENAIMFLLGQVMKKSKGQAEPDRVKALIINNIKK